MSEKITFTWIKCLLAVFCTFATVAHTVAALPQQYRFSHLDINAGLSNNQVKCFLKDSRGFLWVGTASGLNRYDGYKFKVFRYDSNDSSSVISNNIIKLFEGPEGEIWVLTSEGFSVYNPKTESFSRHNNAYIKRYALPDANIEDIVKDKDDNYWFISTGQGITKYNAKTKRSINIKNTFSGKSSISTNYVSALGITSKGEVWIIHSNGILEKLDRETLKVLERNDKIYTNYNQQLQTYALTIDSDDDLWVYLPGAGGGVFLYEQNHKQLSHIHKGSTPLKLNNDIVRGVVEGAKGKIWIGTDHGGINIIHKKASSVEYVLHNNEVKNSLAHNSIYTLYKDGEGIIWIGTFKKGLNFFHQNIIKFQHLAHQTSDKSSLPYDDVNAFVEDEKGNLWIGTNGNGLLYMDRASGAYTRYTHEPGNPNSLSSDIVVSLLIDKKQQLWIGTYMGGLNRFDGKTFTHYQNDLKKKHSLADDNVWELFEDSKGNLWAGTLHGGLELYDPQLDGFRHSMVGSGEYSVHCNYITSLAEDRHGNLWVGGGYGIDVINKYTGKSFYFSHDAKQAGSLVSNHVMSIYRDSKNNVWIGTTEGLDLYNEKDNTFRHFTIKDGLPNNTVVSILEDSKHNLWVSTLNGLSHVVVDRVGGDALAYTVQFRNYDELDGLQGKAFNENAAFKTSKGELLFGGASGLNIIHPHQIVKNEVVPRVVFTDLQLFNKSIGIGKEVNGKVKLEKSLFDTESITLEHNENVFSIEFAALNFFHSEKNIYKYKLEGFDKDWHTSDSQNRRVTYTNLDPGEYQFKVLASNNDGVWNTEGATLTIVVLAPFWQTTTAYVLYVLVAVALLVAVRKAELKKAKVKFLLEQERREAQQTRELNLMKIKFFTNISHEFRTPLSLILSPLEKLLSISENTEQQKQLQMMNRNAKRLLNLVNQLLDFRKLEVEDVNLSLSEGNIVKFIKESVNSFSDLSEKKNISLVFHANIDRLQAYFDMDKLEKILFNLLSNAFKFTPEKGSISVNLNCYDNDSSSEGLKLIEIKVQDTGIGIPKNLHERVFERFFRNDVPSNLVNQGSGIGLAITTEFVKIHGGIIKVDSEPGKGSCFTVTIPVREIAASLEAIEADEAATDTAESERDEFGLTGARKQATVANLNSKPIVLIVEDNEDFRFYLKDNLGTHFTIVEAQNGKEGWQKALSCMPDLIVSDLMMPELNGIELCEKVKGDSRTSHIPFVLLTAHSGEEQKLKGLNIGANDYVTKPFSFELLLSRIRNLITQRQMLQKVLEKKISVQTSEVEIVSLDDKLIQKAIKVVEDNLANPDFSVEMLSKELAMSRVHLYKKVLSLTGSSPVEFIRKIRLQHAAQLLEKSQLTVAEVAYKVGFNNRKYFTKYFKEEYKVLPSLYAESRQK
ncbi:hybrid sensor histidine kinase/response regulator transcription factor [Pontibacter sp. SGAir0037]|uniref:hybrid sensor histidine kinase/response regulator transcription factor n=1 Tax=Pontibacter sp. SGAir0037 TaxID=2571030 RepID=UPI0010CD21E6|nr:hybrid sensor histidine kinase/response regulator transcription factor [Pontibacter sp. SGAir0037]QCR25098.1 hybrid sensor histidine kinase/response regulator [Pontibacter sp. SGAir0037]